MTMFHLLENSTLLCTVVGFSLELQHFALEGSPLFLVNRAASCVGLNFSIFSDSLCQLPVEKPLLQYGRACL